MIKYRVLILFALFSLTKIAFGQSKDTSITYYKFDKSISKVSFSPTDSADSADFVRLVYPYDRENKNYPVKEFYSNGKTKLAGQYEEYHYKLSQVGVRIGDFISFYPNGKRQNISHYINGQKVGQEYLFYPTGLTMSIIIWDNDREKKPKYWEFYNTNGDKICTTGNGHWINYDVNFKPIIEGEVKDGLFEGIWHGKTFQADSITYIYNYHNGEITSGIGYDKEKKAYPFEQYYELSSINKNPIKFLKELNQYFKPDKQISKKFLDTARVSFIIEKDGSTSSAMLIGINDPSLSEAIIKALSLIKDITPPKYYGIPVRSKVILPVKIPNEVPGANFLTELKFIEI